MIGRTVVLLSMTAALAEAQGLEYVRSHYTKYEYSIAMRDGVKLFTSVYVPKDLSQKYPIMLDRTPYSVAPYGLDNYRKELGPSEKLGKDGFIFVYQDVRGGNMAHLNYYAGLCGYIHAKKQGSLVFGNPGTNTVEDYFKYNAADALMIFEHKSTAYPGFQPSSWVRYYPAARFSNTVYAVPSASTMSSYVTKAKSQNAGWVFITNDKLPNPYDTLPTYWTQEVSAIAAANVQTLGRADSRD